MVSDNQTRRRQNIYQLFFILLQILVLLSSHSTFGLKILQPRKVGSSFKIAIFADLHFGENTWTNWGPKQDVNSLKVMSSILEVENPGSPFFPLLIFNFFLPLAVESSIFQSDHGCICTF